MNMGTVTSEHWLNNIIDRESRRDDVKYLPAMVFSVRLSGERWSFATDGRIGVAVKDDIGAPAFKGRTDVAAVMSVPKNVEPTIESWDLLREWAGPVEFEKQVACKECHGDGKSECDKCGSIAKCCECEGTGKGWAYPEDRYATIGGYPINRLLLARGLSGGQSGACKVYLPTTDEGFVQIRDDCCIVTLALLRREADVLEECGESLEDFKGKH
jgi:hypothetical protein